MRRILKTATAIIFTGLAVLSSSAEAVPRSATDERVVERSPASPAEQARRLVAIAGDGGVEAAAEGRSPRAVVRSPFTFLDREGDGRPVHHPRGDITVFQVANGPQFVTVRFRLRQRPDTWQTATTGAVIRVDLPQNGPQIDYNVAVVGARQRLHVVVVPRTRPNQPTCVNSNVSKLGADRFGYGYAARFRFDCIGGRRAFRSRMAFVYSWWPGDPIPTVDFAPDTAWSPAIRPS